MKKFSDFDDYEKEIVNSLNKLFPDQYPYERAKKMVEQYYQVMERVGWHCSPEQWAKNFNEVINKKISPEEWNENLNKLKEYPDDITDEEDPNIRVYSSLGEFTKVLRETQLQSYKQTGSVVEALNHSDNDKLIKSLKDLGIDIKIVNQTTLKKENGIEIVKNKNIESM